MTAEEAIKILMSLKRNAEIYVESVPEHTLKQIPTIVNCAKACDVAIEALEKMVAKKPVRKSPLCYAKLINGEERYAYDHHCPACDVKLKLCEHHCTCGQAIDWRVEE